MQYYKEEMKLLKKTWKLDFSQKMYFWQIQYVFLQGL
jgi:hypothetical protein